MSKTTAIRNRDGSISEVPSNEVVKPSNSLSGFFDVADLGMEVNKEDYADSFKLDGLPHFTFRIRLISNKIKHADAGFALLAVKELGLDEKARQQLEAGDVKDITDAMVEERALQLLGMEVFRSSPSLSAKFDQLLRERYLSVILGDPDSEDPADWGGLVCWISNQLPFKVENVRAANIRLLTQLFNRIMGLANYGLDDHSFRKSNNSGAR